MAQGADAQFSYGLELAEGIPGGTEVFMGFVNEDMGMNRPDEPNPNIDPSGEEVEGDNLRVDGAGKYSSAYDVASILRERAHFFGWYAHTSPVGGVDQYVLRKQEAGDADPTIYLDSLAYNIYRGDGNPQRLSGAKISETNLKLQEYKHAILDRTVLMSRDTHIGDPDLTTGTASDFSGVAVVTGHRTDPASSDAILMKVIDGGLLDGTATVAFTKGATPFVATTKFAVVNGKRIAVVYGDFSHAGKRLNREEVYVTFWTDDPLDELTAGDIWTLDPIRSVMVPTYSTAMRLTGVDAQIEMVIGGVTRTTDLDLSLHSLDIKTTRPYRQNGGLGSKYNFSVNKTGQMGYVITAGRDYMDLDFYRALVNGDPAAVDIQVVGAQIGSTAYYETHHIEMLTGKVKQAGGRVGNRDILPETVEIRAGHIPGFTTYRETIIVGGIPTL